MKAETEEALLEPQLGGSMEDGFRDFLEAVFQQIDEVFFFTDAGSPRPYYVSHAFERIWGRPCESVYREPSSWFESIHPDDRDAVVKQFQLETGSIQAEYRIIRPDGTIRWIWLRTFPIWSSAGTLKRLVGIAQDYTERKQVEKNRDFLAAIVESSDDSIIGTDLEGNILSWNEAAEKLFGYTRAEALGQHITILFDAEKSNSHLTTIDKIKRQESIERFESVRVGKGGRRIDVATILSPVRDVEGRLQGVSAIYRDIADRKRAEREREAMEIQLRHAQRLESIGQLAAGIAHEINTPAQYIGDNIRFLRSSFNDLIEVVQRQRALSESPGASGTFEGQQTGSSVSNIDLEYLMGEVPQAIDQTLDGVSHISTIVGAMREFSHPGTKEKQPLDLNHAISNTITVARNEWKYVAEVETDYDSSLPLVLCLPGDFNQVMLNLIVNAAHAIADVVKGGEKGTIVVQTRNQISNAEIRIRDTGGGIPDHIRDRVFEPFFTTKPVGRGTGQGLALARAIIVDKHRGQIDFETEPGKGTTFVVRLPISEPAVVRA